MAVRLGTLARLNTGHIAPIARDEISGRGGVAGSPLGSCGGYDVNSIITFLTYGRSHWRSLRCDLLHV
jgi:hypothetical protein